MSDRSPSSDDLKYARGHGPRIEPGHRSLSIFELAVLGHVGVFVVGTTWAFGGQADWLTTPLSWWGSLSVLITLTALQDRQAWRDGWARAFLWLLPLAAFNALVVAATFNPSLHEMKVGAETLLLQEGAREHLPSSARPSLALRALWLFDAIWLSCFNVALLVRQRRTVRLLLVLAVANAAALAVFGTAQKLTQAQGLYFNAVPSPQERFFATFIYHNHWGAFMLLMMAACLALVWHYSRRRDARDFFHTPASGGLVLLLLMAASVPLSGSRSAMLLAIALLGLAFLHAVVRLIRKRRHFNESIAPPLIGAVAAVLLAAGGIWYIARDTIRARVAKTHEQVEEMRMLGGLGHRAELYRNTWQMAKDKPWFGWGMASYPHVFTLYNTQRPADRLPVFYRDAHSDWLQGFAEHGAVGCTLLGLMALVPLAAVGRRVISSPISAYLIAGCGLIVLYATIEFPFGNVAVLLSWWLCFFCAVQYARLQKRDDAVSAPAKA